MIVYNNLAARQIIVGVVLGLLAGVLADRLGYTGYSNSAGAFVGFLSVVAHDIQTRLRSDPEDSWLVRLVHYRAGGQVMFVPTWVLATGIFALILARA